MDMVEIHNMVNDYIKTKLNERKKAIEELRARNLHSAMLSEILTVRIDEIDNLLENVFKCDDMEIVQPEITTMGAVTRRMPPDPSADSRLVATNYSAQANAPIPPKLAAYYNDCAEDATWD